MYIIFINGPPRSGKDTVADYLVTKGYTKMKMAGVLFDDIKKILNLTDEQYNLYREEKKDEPLVFDTTLRQISINYSEKVAIPRHGQYYWSKIFLENARNSGFDKIVVSDLGFQREYDYFLNSLRFPYEQFSVIRIEREGCSFANDSREYVSSFDFKIVNDGSVLDLQNRVDVILENI
jgi:hypothetical protein